MNEQSACIDILLIFLKIRLVDITNTEPSMPYLEIHQYILLWTKEEAMTYLQKPLWSYLRT